MQRDVRRSEATDGSAEPEKASKGFTRSLFRLGRGKKAALQEPARLTERLKEVLERDRALIASEPEPLAQDHIELHDEDLWQEETQEHVELQVWRHDEPAWGQGLEQPFDVPDETGTRATERGVLQLAEARESSELRLSQIASWIEEEITGRPLGEAPLDPDEAAELDAVLAEPELAPAPEPAPAPKSARARSAPGSRAQVKAKVSARPAARVAEASPPATQEQNDIAPGKEPIRTLTMARLLAMQGYKPRALAVYRELLARSPDDAALRAEYEALNEAE